MLNTHFWFDLARDVAGIVMTQTLPFVDAPFLSMCEQFERTYMQAD